MVDVQLLLDELCTNLGFCLAPADQVRLRNDPPAGPDAFADEVVRAEGLDPATMRAGLRRDIMDVVRRHFGEDDSVR